MKKYYDTETDNASFVRCIRNIVFAFPVPYNGKEIREFPLESQSTVECVLSLSKV